MENVIREYVAALEKIEQESTDDIHDLASWLAALDTVRAKVQRRITDMLIRNTDEAHAAANRPRAFRIVVEPEK